MRCVLLLFALTAAAAHGDVRESMLVSPDWLAQRLGDKSLVVLHTGTQKDYEEAHIPDARLITLGEISVTGERGLRLELPDVESLRSAFAKKGISDDSRVIIYAGTESVQSATRVWFTLDYLGLGSRASLLDGGLGRWKAEGRPLSTAVPEVREGALTVTPRRELVVDAAWLQSHRDDAGVRLIDARTPEFYTGANAGSMPRAGHIPGAVNVPFTSTLDDARNLKPAEDLRRLIGAGEKNDGKLHVTYCHIGQQATLLYFVAKYLGLEARLYDGSFQDWSSRTDLPVASATP